MTPEAEEDPFFSLYLSRSDCPPSEIATATEGKVPQPSSLITSSLSARETSDMAAGRLEDAFRRRIILNPFTEESRRAQLLSAHEQLEDDSFILSVAAEAFKSHAVRRGLKRVQEETRSFLDWDRIEAQANEEQISEFAGGIELILNKLKSI